MRKYIQVSFITRYANLFIQIGIMAMLSRLLSPEEFGIVTVAQVFVVFFNIVGNTGISAAIVQDRTLEGTEISSIYKVSLAFAVVLSSMFYAIAPLIARFYSNPIYLGIIHYLSISLFFSVAAMVPQAIMQRDKEFKLIGVVNIIATLVSGGIGVFAAKQNASSYSIVFQSVAFAFCTWVLSYRLSSFRFLSGFAWTGIRKIFHYSVYQFLFNFVNYFARNADNMLIGKYLGATSLGYYGRAYQLMMMPIQHLTFVINPVLHSVFSDSHNDKNQLYNNYLSVVRVLAFIGMLIGPICVVNANDIIALMFGRQWGAAATPFAILSISVPFQMITSTSGSIFQAANDTRRLFWSGMLNSTIIVGAFCVAIFGFGNIQAVSVSVASAYAIVAFSTYTILLHLTLRVSIRSIILTIVPYLFAGIISYLGVIAFPIPSIINTEITRLVYNTAVISAFYFSFVYLIPSGRSVVDIFLKRS